jgi:hypothetical protein
MPSASMAPGERKKRAVGGGAGEGMARETREKRGVRVETRGALARSLVFGGAALDHAKSVAALAARLATQFIH